MTRPNGPRLPTGGEVIRMRMTSLRSYCGPFITRSGLRCRPSYPALSRKAVVTAPNPADLIYR